MAGTAADARAMADNYLTLEATARPEDRRRYHTMAYWWLKRADDIDIQTSDAGPVPVRTTP